MISLHSDQLAPLHRQFLLHTVTQMLNTNSHVIVIATDFSKAFDTVRHVSLLEKFAALDVPDYVYNWLVDFFSGRTQCTTFHNVTSELHEGDLR